MIGAMSPEIMAELPQAKADSNPLPLGQKMAMQNLVRPTASVPQGNAAPLNPQMTFPPADHGNRCDGWDPDSLRGLFNDHKRREQNQLTERPGLSGPDGVDENAR